MDEGKQILKEQVNKLPKELRDYVMNGNWANKLQDILSGFRLEEYQKTSIENEVLLVLVCLEPKKDFVDNIKVDLQLDQNIINWIVEDVEKNIFSKVTNEIDSMWQAMEQEEEEVREEIKEESIESEAGNGVGQSFEQIILNQAKAMQPAREAPANLPTREQKTEEKPSDFAKAMPDKKVIHNYIGESDPYREPIE